MRHERRDHESIHVVGIGARQQAHAGVGRDIVDELRLARLEDAADDALAEGQRVGLDLFGDRPAPDDRLERASVRLSEIHRARLAGKQIDRVLGYPFQHRCRVERRRDLPTHIREGRHLLGPSVGLPVEPGILDRRPDACGDRRQEPDIVRPESTLLVRALDADNADGLIAGNDRHAEP
jgi:hypothetical protein